MSYYDNVKDNVKDEKGENSSKPSFDTLREEAEKTSVEDDEEKASDDDTPIEVLEEGGLRKETPSGKEQNSQPASQQGSPAQPSNQQSNTRQQGRQENRSTGQPHSQSGGSGTGRSQGKSQDLSSVEDKLDKLIEQNRRIIEVLESFGQ